MRCIRPLAVIATILVHVAGPRSAPAQEATDGASPGARLLFAPETGWTRLEPLAFSADGTRLGTIVRDRGFLDHMLVRYDQCTVRAFDSAGDAVRDVVYSEKSRGYELVHIPYGASHPLLDSGDLLLVGGVPGVPPRYPLASNEVEIVLREGVSQREIATFNRPRKGLSAGSVALNPKEPVLALALYRQAHEEAVESTVASTIELLSVPQGTPTFRFESRDYCFDCLAFSPDGRHFAAAGGRLWGSGDNYSSQVLIWDTATGELLHEREANFRALSAAFSPDGNTLVVGGFDANYDGGVNLAAWRVDTGESAGQIDLARPPQAPRERLGETRVDSLAFSPDRRFLAVGVGAPHRGARWGEVRLLNADTFEVLEILLEKHDSVVESVVFSADGRWLAALTLDSRMLIWDMTKLEVD